MTNRILRIAAVVAFAGASSSAWAIHVENGHPGLQNPKAQLVETARAAELTLSGETNSISSSGFTGFNGNGIKRKPFPPGFSRSGYTFEDEVLRPVAPPAVPAEEKAETQPASRPSTDKP